MVDPFGLQKHGEQRAEVERPMRHLLEQVAQSTVDLRVVSADIGRLQRELDRCRD